MRSRNANQNAFDYHMQMQIETDKNTFCLFQIGRARCGKRFIITEIWTRSKCYRTTEFGIIS